MGRFDISPEVAEEYRRKFNEAVQAELEEEVLAAGTFRTTGSGTKYAISKARGGALAYGAAHLMGKKKAGGLPGSSCWPRPGVAVVLTPTCGDLFGYIAKFAPQELFAGPGDGTSAQ